MRICCAFTSPIKYESEEDYVRHHEIEVKCYGEEVMQDFIVAKFSVDQIMYWDAINDDVSIFEICDCDSDGMHQLNVILSDGKDEFREDLEIVTHVEHIMFMHKVVFHPEIDKYKQVIIDAVFNLFGRTSLAVTWDETTGLSSKQLAELGFKKVVSSYLIYRESAYSTPFEEMDHEEMDLDFFPTEEHEEWVMKEWEKEPS